MRPRDNKRSPEAYWRSVGWQSLKLRRHHLTPPRTEAIIISWAKHHEVDSHACPVWIYEALLEAVDFKAFFLEKRPQPVSELNCGRW